MKRAFLKLRLPLFFFALAHSETPASAAPPEAWPYWPEYHKTPLDEVRPQKWVKGDQVIEGWDWSLPPDVKPAPNGLLAFYRTSNINKPFDKQFNAIDLPVNETVEIWVKWRDLEPKEGTYKFDVVKDRIKEAQKLGLSVVLRMLCSGTTFTPEWITAYNIPIAENKTKKPAKITNYDISHPEFHKRYLLLIEHLGKSGIPKMESLKGAYVGYASPAFGDEGIGPHGQDPDQIPHVVERLDAWAKAFKGVESKVYMGGISQHGFNIGFGARRGFVEMYLYHIPDQVIGQTVDEDGYLYVDESAEILKRRLFHGEENEEYEESWATEERGNRFGKNTDSFTYRYFISNLRTLQMQCNHVLMNPFSIYPEQMVWVGQSLGRTVDDSPDIWCALRESYLRGSGAVKNVERWLYQRDQKGCETSPAVKIDHPIQMWMTKPDHHYDYIARKGKRIGLAVDDRWAGGKPVDIAVKVSYFDQGTGTVDVGLKTKEGDATKQIKLIDSNKLKTATFIFNNAIFPAKEMDYDIIFNSSGSDAVLSFVRVIRLDQP